MQLHLQSYQHRIRALAEHLQTALAAAVVAVEEGEVEEGVVQRLLVSVIRIRTEIVVESHAHGSTIVDIAVVELGQSLIDNRALMMVVQNQVDSTTLTMVAVDIVLVTCSVDSKRLVVG